MTTAPVSTKTTMAYKSPCTESGCVIEVHNMQELRDKVPAGAAGS